MKKTAKELHEEMVAEGIVFIPKAKTTAATPPPVATTTPTVPASPVEVEAPLIAPSKLTGIARAIEANQRKQGAKHVPFTGKTEKAVTGLQRAINANLKLQTK